MYIDLNDMNSDKKIQEGVIVTILGTPVSFYRDLPNPA